MKPMVVCFHNYTDTEVILKKVYLRKGSGFGIYRQYPKKITYVRSTLYKSADAVTARNKDKTCNSSKVS